MSTRALQTALRQLVLDFSVKPATKRPAPVAYEVYASVGSSVESQVARRVGEDQWFVRRREHDPRFGWKWSAWQRTSAPRYTPPAPGEWGAGHGHLPMQQYVPKIRLPR